MSINCMLGNTHTHMNVYTYIYVCIVGSENSPLKHSYRDLCLYIFLYAIVGS